MDNKIKHYYGTDGSHLAMVIPADYSGKGIVFLTENDSYMQVAYMGHPENHEIKPHYHNRIPRTVDYTCETLIIRKGILEVDLYENQKIIYTFRVEPGDIISLFSGGHGFRVIEEVEMVEIKQGPFMGEGDKTRF